MNSMKRQIKKHIAISEVPLWKWKRVFVMAGPDGQNPLKGPTKTLTLYKSSPNF